MDSCTEIQPILLASKIILKISLPETTGPEAEAVFIPYPVT